MDSLVFLILAHFVDIFHGDFNTMYNYRSVQLLTRHQSNAEGISHTLAAIKSQLNS